MDKVLNEITKFVKGEFNPGIWTLPYETYEFGDYLKKYHNLKSFYVSISVLNCFFVSFSKTGSQKGRVLYDRWLSLVSTARALGQ